MKTIVVHTVMIASLHWLLLVMMSSYRPILSVIGSLVSSPNAVQAVGKRNIEWTCLHFNFTIIHTSKTIRYNFNTK